MMSTSGSIEEIFFLNFFDMAVDRSITDYLLVGADGRVIGVDMSPEMIQRRIFTETALVPLQVTPSNHSIGRLSVKN
jgi:hypothetical protein